MHPATAAWVEADAAFRDRIIARLRAEGAQMTATLPNDPEVPYASTGWDDERNTGHMLEVLCLRGDVAAAGRRGACGARRAPPAVARHRAGEAAALARRALAERALDLFDFEYMLEMYKPAGQRRWGYFALPILVGDRLVGKLDAKADRRRGVLTVNAVHQDLPLSPADADAVDAEIAALAEWLGLELRR